jgi:formate dehydrogenase alpha subunit
LADAVLPGAAISEKQGSVTNLEGRIQSFDPVVPPPGKARADWQILDLLAARLNGGKPHESVADIRKEIRRLIPMYASLNGRHEAWLEMSSAKSVFDSRGAAELISFYPVVATEDLPADPDYPFTAIVGTQRYQLGSGTRTGASERIREFDSAGNLAMSPTDAADLDLADGSTVAVTSPQGTLRREIQVRPDLNPGQIFIPTGVKGNDAMNLFDLSDLTTSKAAGWKTCEVKIEKI